MELNFRKAMRLVLEELNGDIYKLKPLYVATTVIAREFCKTNTLKYGKCLLSNECAKRVESLRVV